MLVHNVFFTLNDFSSEAQQKLIAACNRCLADQAGVKFFAVGTLVKDLDRPVNDLNFHVGLHVVFENRAAHDVYQVSPQHVQFIDENKDNWKQVRVFDSTDD